ncbi:primosomal replication protein N [Ideonella sp. YS5]|uniref:primosomal replication protein N n=1 Tax=Ideonella sp. YS5 TaxID=3453714 RepID=UPI003EE821D5
MNRLILAAEVVERGATRYTPAGLPALDLMLKHQSQVTEDGQPRQIAMQLKAVAIGEITRPVAALALGTPAQFAGFLTASRNGKGLVFHVTELDT